MSVKSDQFSNFFDKKTIIFSWPIRIGKPFASIVANRFTTVRLDWKKIYSLLLIIIKSI